MDESLLRVFNHCQTVAARRPGVICDKDREVLHICQLVPALWIEVRIEQAIGGRAQIRVTEFRVRGFKRHQACCAWEASTLIEQILFS